MTEREMLETFFTGYAKGLGVANAEHNNPSDPRYEATLEGLRAVMSFWDDDGDEDYYSTGLQEWDHESMADTLYRWVEDMPTEQLRLLWRWILLVWVQRVEEHR